MPSDEISNLTVTNVQVSFDRLYIVVTISDGSVVVLKRHKTERLLWASTDMLQKVRVIGDLDALVWPELDETVRL